MKKYFKFIVPLFVILNLTTNVECEIIRVTDENRILEQKVDRLQAVKEKGVLTVLSSNEEPNSYKNVKTGEFSGINADIIKEVAKRLGIKEVRAKYDYLAYLFDDINKQPDADLVVDGIFITDERKKLVDFTNPIYKDWNSVLIREDSNINSKEDLKNAIVGAVEGQVYVPILKQWKSEGKIKDYLIFFNKESSRIALSNKIIDALLTDTIVGQNYVLKYPELKLKLLTTTQYKPDVIYDVGYALKKEDTTLKNAVNEKIQEMREDGTLYEILTKYGIKDHYIQ